MADIVNRRMGLVPVIILVMMKLLSSLQKQELENKKVLVRADFNVPVTDGKIEEIFRIKALKETTDFLLENGAKVAIVSHIESIPNFLPITEQVGEILGQVLTLVPLSELKSIGSLFENCPTVLIDNIRQDSREMENSEGFARELAEGFDFYINDAFAVSHRNHASVLAITNFLPSYAGFQMEKEIDNLCRALNEPAEGKIIVLGGAKISTKLPTIKNFLNKAEKILIGGALANNFFRFQGLKTGKSLVDEESLNLLSELYESGIIVKKIILPIDFVVAKNKEVETSETKITGDVDEEEAILDIGPETAKKFAELIEEAKMIIWNGPMGFFEIDKFALGTKSIADAVTMVKQSLVGGGDTILAVEKLGLLDKFSFVSTGGGAMLDFLAGKKLPGLEVLGYYD
jgi:3-phosphoglycerate kinase